MSVSEDSWSRWSSENSSRMETFHSSQSQCCCCVVAVLVSLGGVIMTSIGVCLLLNYGMINLNMGILPPELQTGEGKKIIGIILICFGITGVIISSLVSILFFTICHSPSPQTISPLYYDNRTNNKSMHLNRSLSPSIMSDRPNRCPSSSGPSTSTPRNGYNTKKKKMTPSRLESVKEDPIGPFPNPLPILQINGTNANGSLLPMRDISLGSFRSQSSRPSYENNNLHSDATSSVDIATIQVSQMEKKDLEINSSKL